MFSVHYSQDCILFTGCVRCCHFTLYFPYNSNDKRLNITWIIGGNLFLCEAKLGKSYRCLGKWKAFILPFRVHVMFVKYMYYSYRNNMQGTLISNFRKENQRWPLALSFLIRKDQIIYIWEQWCWKYCNRFKYCGTHLTIIMLAFLPRDYITCYWKFLIGSYSDLLNCSNKNN